MSPKDYQPAADISLVDLFAVLRARWKVLAAAMILGAVVMFVVSTFLPKVYESKATIYVQESSRNLSSVRELSVIGISTSSTSGYLNAILQSETMARAVIADLGLLSDSAFTKGSNIGEEDAVRALRRVALVKDNNKGRIDLFVRVRDPRLAARICNSMLGNLSRLVKTRSERKADFIRGKLDETSAELRVAENKLLDFQKRNEVAALDEETRKVIEELGQIDAQALALDVQLQGVSSELANAGELKSLLDMEVRKRSLQAGKDHVLAKRAELERRLTLLPSVALEYSRLERRVRVLAKTFELLTDQYQLTRVSQYGEDGEYQIIDRATPRTEPIGPRRLLNTAAGAIIALMIALALVFGSVPSPKRHRD